MKKDNKSGSTDGIVKEAELSGRKIEAMKKRQKSQQKKLGDHWLPKSYMPSTLSKESIAESFRQFKEKCVGKKLFVQEN